MALKKTLTDPLNWLLLLLAAAFVYYIFAVPYFTDFYLKTPQELTLEEYLSNPSHPRPFMLHALSAPPASIEVVITGLTVRHVDQDSILLEDPSLPADSMAGAGAAGEDVGTDEGAAADGAAGADEGAAAGEPTDGDDAAAGTEAPQQPAAADQEPAEETGLEYVDEAPAPRNQILVAGENLDLLGVTPGQTVSLRAHGLHETPLGWVPQEVTVAQDQEEYFNKEELDALELMAIITDGNEVTVPYVEVGEFRFAPGTHPPGEPMTLADLANDTTYVQAAQRLAGGAGAVDLMDVRLVERRTQDRSPFFVVENAEGQRARVFFNPRMRSEWYWAMDRLGGEPVVIRGTLRLFAPSDLRQLETDGNIQAVLDGYDVLSRDGDEVGAIVINLENPLGGGPGDQ